MSRLVREVDEVLVSPVMLKSVPGEMSVLLRSIHTTSSLVVEFRVSARLILHSRVYILPAVGIPPSTGETLTT